MKKRILSLLLCALMLLSLLPSCAKERYDLLNSIDVGERTYCVRGSANRAKQIVVKSGDAVLFSQKVKVDKSVGAQNGSYGFAVLDLNFDGHMDLMIATDVEVECVFYDCWLYVPATDSYEKSEALSGLANLVPDAKLQAVFGFSQEFSSTPAPAPNLPPITVSRDLATKYIWQNGELIPSIRVTLTYYSETDRYLYSVYYYDEQTKKLEWDTEHWMTPEEYRETDLSFLYYYR